jgi:hypothetical protein
MIENTPVSRTEATLSSHLHTSHLADTSSTRLQSETGQPLSTRQVGSPARVQITTLTTPFPITTALQCKTYKLPLTHACGLPTPHQMLTRNTPLFLTRLPATRPEKAFLELFRFFAPV